MSGRVGKLVSSPIFGSVQKSRFRLGEISHYIQRILTRQKMWKKERRSVRVKKMEKHRLTKTV